MIPDTNKSDNFAPSIKFIVAVYTGEIVIVLIIMAWLLSRAAP